MDTKSLIWFREVCDCKSINKAAANLFITPQGLSRAVKSLEGELGVSLLERTAFGVSPTIYGDRLYERSETLLFNFENLVAEMRLLEQQEKGLLRVVSSFGVFRILGIEFIMEFKERHPEIELDYMEYPDSFIEKYVRNENFDIGFAIGPFNKEGLTTIKLFSSGVSLLVYKNHPLAKRESVSFADLENEKLILESREFKINALVDSACRNAGFFPNVIYHTSGFSLCHKMTTQERCISVVVDLISKDMINENLRLIPFEDSFDWDVYLIWNKKKGNNQFIKEWKDYTLNYIESNKIDLLEDANR